jgi:hypothetical protein
VIKNYEFKKKDKVNLRRQINVIKEIYKNKEKNIVINEL